MFGVLAAINAVDALLASGIATPRRAQCPWPYVA
jgi:hypothetical protein